MLQVKRDHGRNFKPTGELGEFSPRGLDVRLAITARLHEARDARIDPEDHLVLLGLMKLELAFWIAEHVEVIQLALSLDPPPRL